MAVLLEADARAVGARADLEAGAAQAPRRRQAGRTGGRARGQAATRRRGGRRGAAVAGVLCDICQGIVPETNPHAVELMPDFKVGSVQHAFWRRWRRVPRVSATTMLGDRATPVLAGNPHVCDGVAVQNVVACTVRTWQGADRATASQARVLGHWGGKAPPRRLVARAARTWQGAWHNRAFRKVPTDRGKRRLGSLEGDLGDLAWPGDEAPGHRGAPVHPALVRTQNLGHSTCLATHGAGDVVHFSVAISDTCVATAVRGYRRHR